MIDGVNLDEDIEQLAWSIKAKAEALPGAYKTVASDAAMLILHVNGKDLASAGKLAVAIVDFLAKKGKVPVSPASYAIDAHAVAAESNGATKVASDWRTMEARPEGVFDVLAREYDPGLNRFILRRLTNCVLEGMDILLPHPFDVGQHWSISGMGLRVVAWRPSPGPEDIPDWLDAFASGPKDRNND